MLLNDIDAMSEQSEFNTHKILSDVNTGSLGLRGLDIGAEGGRSLP